MSVLYDCFPENVWGVRKAVDYFYLLYNYSPGIYAVGTIDSDYVCSSFCKWSTYDI